MWIGSCKQCGRCCSRDNMWLRYGDEVARDLLIEFNKARGYHLVQDTGVSLQFKVKLRCQQLGGDNRCKIYDDRPELCKMFPHSIGKIPGADMKKLVPNKCGFKWKDDDAKDS